MGRYEVADQGLMGADGHDEAYYGMTRMSLVEQISSSECTEGVSYQCKADGVMWVDKGCRGHFSCGSDGQITCSSNGYAYAECDCAACDHGGEECWTSHGCTDDGATPCEWCGGDDWFCCNKWWTYDE